MKAEHLMHALEINEWQNFLHMNHTTIALTAMPYFLVKMVNDQVYIDHVKNWELFFKEKTNVVSMYGIRLFSSAI